MYNSINQGSLINKLKVLGNQVQVINDSSVITIDNKSKKYRVIIQDEDSIIKSDEYDDIKNISNTDYYIVSEGQRCGVIHRTDKIIWGEIYKEIRDGIITSNNNCNITVRLSDNLQGVMDVNCNTIIPFYHSHIYLYKNKYGFIYLGNTLDAIKIYNDRGIEFGVSKFIGTKGVILCSDCVIIYEQNKIIKHGTDYLVYSMEGKLLMTVGNGSIINKGEYYQLVDGKGDIIKNKIYKATRY